MGKPAAGVFRVGDENTLVGVADDDNSFCQKGRTFDVHAGLALEVLTSHNKLKLGNKNLQVYQMLLQHVARDNSGLSQARRKDATCFLRWIMRAMGSLMRYGDSTTRSLRRGMMCIVVLPELKTTRNPQSRENINMYLE